ncbi:unnamed protein product, partial [Didymodactylos carnosus]
KAEYRDYDDHIDYLIKKNLFDEAVDAFERPPNNQRPKRHTRQSLYRTYVKHLIDDKKTEEAVKLFQEVYKTSEEWEKQIIAFLQRNELQVITPYIPTTTIKLSPVVYEQVLNEYLNQKKYDILKQLLTEWPSELYDLNCIERKIRLQLTDENTSVTLLECSAIIMKNPQAFELIVRQNLYKQVLPKVETLLRIDRQRALDLLVEQVVSALENNRLFLHLYLDALFNKNAKESSKYHTLQVTLYSEFDPDKLMTFLRKATYNIPEALAVCEKKRLYRETVFLYGRAGNPTVALRIILTELNDINYAIEFCREQGINTLWTQLIEQSRNKPAFISGLLNNAGSDINPQILINNINTNMQIPGLRDSLCKIMQDYNIQMSLSECCRKIIVQDCLSLRKKTVDLLQHGYLVKGISEFIF